jgi:glycosyltransferase involved in cell wall biosynthesis
MRILVISNFYPPLRIDGYAQWCQEVSEGLQERGHDVWVLTSRHQAASANPAPRVRRLLYLENDLFYYSPRHFFTQWPREEAENRRIVADTVVELRPDIVFIWGMRALSHGVPAVAEGLDGSRVAYYISDHWPANPSLHEMYWRQPARTPLGRLAKPLLARTARLLLKRNGHPCRLRFSNAMVVSEAVRCNLTEAGLPFQTASVVHGGSDVDRLYRSRDYTGVASGERPLRLLYAGYLGQHKGVHTALSAVALLAAEGYDQRLHLTVVGSGHPAYERELQWMLEAHDLRDVVTFTGPVPPDRMPGVLAQHDVLLFPSIYREPLARTMQEAMLAGLLVVGTTTGGSGEMLVEGVTGLTFKEDTPSHLASQLIKVVREPELVPELAQQGQTSMLAHFTLERMIDDVDAYLTGVVSKV